MREAANPERAPRRRPTGWVAATVAVCGLFWGGLYLVWLQPLQEELARLRTAAARAEQELPAARAEQELARVEKELAGLKRRWDTTTAAALARQFEAHGVTLLRGHPGEEAGSFVLEVEGSAHGLGLALPEIEAEGQGGRLPAVLYLRRVKQDQRVRARLTLEGAGQVSDWSVKPAGGER